MSEKLKMTCITALGIALFVVTTLCVQVPVFENYYICMGYIVMTLYCYYFGPSSGMIVGGVGVIIYCLLTNGLRGMPGWAIGNIVIGLIVGYCCKFTANFKNKHVKHLLIGIIAILSVAIGILGIKSLTESLLYTQPIFIRMAKNVYAFISDAAVMIISLPICISLKSTIIKLFPKETMITT